MRDRVVQHSCTWRERCAAHMLGRHQLARKVVDLDHLSSKRVKAIRPSSFLPWADLL